MELLSMAGLLRLFAWK